MNSPIQFTVDGQTYEVSPLTQKLQDAFGRWCEANSWNTLRDFKARCNDAEYGFLLSEHQRLRRTQGFEFGGQEANSQLATPDGYTQFMFLAFRACQGITPEAVRSIIQAHPAECLAIFDQIMETKKKTEPPQDAAAADGAHRNEPGSRQSTV